MTSNHFTLPDGRKLHYYEYGTKDGHPTFYFHGAPSSGLEPLLIGEDVFTRKNIRLIAPNRPGIGQSDFQTNRTFTDWTKDVAALADRLGWDKFSVLGNSGGGGYVTVCAAKIPERLISAVTISGGWPMSFKSIWKHLAMPYKMFWIIAAKLPFLLPMALKTMRSSPNKSKEKEEKEKAQAEKMLHPADFKAMMQGNTAEALSKALNEALVNITGAKHDLRMYVTKWDFDLQDVHFPIHLFHGEEDRNFPIAMVEEFIHTMPAVKMTSFKNEAHLSTLCNHINEALNILLQP